MNRDAVHMTSNDDLDWVAFCYVVDELVPTQRAAFDRRLADDQAARDAVMRASQLVHQIALTANGEDAPSPHTGTTQGTNGPTTTLPEQADQRPTNRVVAALAMAVSLLIGVAAMIWLWSQPQPQAEHAGSENGYEQLAKSWSLTVSGEEMADELDASAAEPDEIENEIVDDETTSWMMVALADLEDPSREDE